MQVLSEIERKREKKNSFRKGKLFFVSGCKNILIERVKKNQDHQNCQNNAHDCQNNIGSPVKNFGKKEQKDPCSKQDEKQQYGHKDSPFLRYEDVFSLWYRKTGELAIEFACFCLFLTKMGSLCHILKGFSVKKNPFQAFCRRKAAQERAA